MDPLSAIASTIALIQAISSTYRAIQYIKGLPKAFKEASQVLPLVENTLALVREQLDSMHLDESSTRTIGSAVHSCEEKAKALHDIFEEVEMKKEANDWLSLSVSNLSKARQVKTLVQDIERGVMGLATNRLFRSATQDQMVNLEKAIQKLSQRADSDARGIHILKTLHTSPYLDRKNRNPERVPGTCEWFVNHRVFQQWQESSSSSMLWVSADPGCGKSVLARHLIDSELPTTASRTTCYFFFKDDFDDQRSVKSALCCILHQLFTRNEILFSSEMVKRFETRETHLITSSFDELWEILMIASQDENAGEIVCILDAFDECEDQGRDMLAQALCKLYRTTNCFRLKFLITCRPYSSIRQGFQPLDIPGLPVVHLSGESEAELSKISREIDIYIRARVRSIRDNLKLNPDKEQLLLRELLRIPNRTYLWVHLTMDLIQRRININKSGIQEALSSIPPTVDDAYEGILNRSLDPGKARKLLHIVVAAARPLNLSEMAVALALQPDRLSYQDLDLDLEADESLREYVRDLCGLFITIINSKIYLLHQTAREFLLCNEASIGARPETARAKDTRLQVCNNTPRWKSSLQLRESHRVLGQICVWYLLSTEFETCSLDKNEMPKCSDHVFLDYSAKNWASHARESVYNDDGVTTGWLREICNAQSRRCLTWLRIYWADTGMDFPQDFTTLMIASYFGLEPVVELLLKEDDIQVNSLDGTYGRSALSWAAENGFDGVVGLLIRGPRFHFKRLTRSSFWKGVQVDTRDKQGRTPLSYAAWNGHMAVVERLVKARARANSKDNIGGTPISYALCSGHEAVANKLMKESPADSVDVIRGELLVSAAERGYRNIVERLLLEKGVNTEAEDSDGRTPLQLAVMDGHEDIVRQLLEKGANTEAADRDGRTPLSMAAQNRHEDIVRQLLEKGANTEAADRDGRTPLWAATVNGHPTIVRRLLEKGANTEAVNNLNGHTPLWVAAWNGHDDIVRQLLEKGANTEVTDRYGQTSLWKAVENGHDTTVRLLLEKGANTDAADRYGWTPLYVAAWNGHDDIVRQLLDKGANTEVMACNGYTPLRVAVDSGYGDIVRQLLEKGANIEAADRNGGTPRRAAAGNGT